MLRSRALLTWRAVLRSRARPNFYLWPVGGSNTSLLHLICWKTKWQHLVQGVKIVNGDWVTDLIQAICKHCKKILHYTAANTSTMQRHVQNYHSSLQESTDNADKAFTPQLPHSSAKAKAMMKDSSVFIATDISVVEKKSRLLATPLHSSFQRLFTGKSRSVMKGWVTDEFGSDIAKGINIVLSEQYGKMMYNHFKG